MLKTLVLLNVVQDSLMNRKFKITVFVWHLLWNYKW